MKKNVGTVDRIIRVILGTALIITGLFTSWLWYIPGVLLILTGAVSFCTPYWILGISTCRVKEKKTE